MKQEHDEDAFAAWQAAQAAPEKKPLTKEQKRSRLRGWLIIGWGGALAIWLITLSIMERPSEHWKATEDELAPVREFLATMGEADSRKGVSPDIPHARKMAKIHYPDHLVDQAISSYGDGYDGVTSRS